MNWNVLNYAKIKRPMMLVLPLCANKTSYDISLTSMRKYSIKAYSILLTMIKDNVNLVPIRC